MRMVSTILMVVVTNLFAQITLTSSDFNALKGVTKNYAKFQSPDGNGLAAVLSATGSGKTWNITGRTWGVADSSLELYSNYPADAPPAASFPLSNVVLKQITKSGSGTTTTWSFYKNDASGYVMYGYVTVQGLTQVVGSYSTPVLAMKYPGMLNASWSTTTNSMVSGFSTAATYDYLIDGEGTVTTPEGTFPCLRSRLKLTTSAFGFSTITYNYTFFDKSRSYASITTDGTGAPVSVSYWRLSTPASLAPPAPTLALPIDGATNVPVNSTLSWSAVAGATSYNIQISTNSTFTTIAVNQTGITTASFSFTNLAVNTIYYWKVSATNASGTGGFSAVQNFRTVASTFVESIRDMVPSAFALSPNYPNPFNPSTSFQINTSTTSRVVLEIYDVMGKQVAILVDQELSPGQYKVNWNATNHQSGAYFARLSVGSFTQSRKVLLVK